MSFSLPDSDVTAIIDAPPTPLIVPSPDEKYLVVVGYEAHPPISMLARPILRLGGLRLDPALGARQRTRRFSSLSVLRISDGSLRPLTLPAGAQVSVPAWSPDGHRFAFMVDEPDGVGVWLADAGTQDDPVQLPGVRVVDVLSSEPPSTGATISWTRDGTRLLVLGAVPGTSTSTSTSTSTDTTAVIEPRIDESVGKKSQMATYQDLLRTTADEDRFEELATTIPLLIDPATGASEQLGPPGLYQYIEDSPDGRYLLVYRLQRPFSFRVPNGLFARRTEIWTAAGESVRVIADLPVSDQVPMMGVPTGPRLVTWDERSPAKLIWVEALDGGDPVAPAEHRDEVSCLAAPFEGEPERPFRLTHRCLGWSNMDAAGVIMATEHDRDRRWLTTWLCDLHDPGQNRVLFDLSEDDGYADPGDPMLVLNQDGTRTIRQHGNAIYLRGDGATPDGDRPFLDRYDLATGQSTRLFHSEADAYESVLCLVGGQASEAVIWHQSQAEPPNLQVVGLGEDQSPGSAELAPRGVQGGRPPS